MRCPVHPAPRRIPGATFMLLLLLASAAVFAACSGNNKSQVAREVTDTGTKATTPSDRKSWAGKEAAPEFRNGLTWFNVQRPLTLADLRGKIVLLDFWTLGCINCQHIVPDLKQLEAEYGDRLVVIGVHSGKYTTEHDDESVREAPPLPLGRDGERSEEADAPPARHEVRAGEDAVLEEGRGREGIGGPAAPRDLRVPVEGERVGKAEEGPERAAVDPVGGVKLVLAEGPDLDRHARPPRRILPPRERERLRASRPGRARRRPGPPSREGRRRRRTSRRGAPRAPRRRSRGRGRASGRARARRRAPPRRGR